MQLKTIAQTVSSSQGRELLVGLEGVERATERRSKFHATLTRALLRILRSEARVLRATIEVSPADEEV